jgi:hypothetical protein
VDCVCHIQTVLPSHAEQDPCKVHGGQTGTPTTVRLQVQLASSVVYPRQGKQPRKKQEQAAHQKEMRYVLPVGLTSYPCCLNCKERVAAPSRVRWYHADCRL